MDLKTKDSLTHFKQGINSLGLNYFAAPGQFSNYLRFFIFLTGVSLGMMNDER
jgi:hypothetical protein